MVFVELTTLLLSCGVPIEEWGKGDAKRVADLAREIEQGECFLFQQGTSLTRMCRVIRINISYRSKDGKALVLVEDHQVFNADGRVRTRRDKGFVGSLWEKIKYGEDPLRAAERCVKEELGMDISSLAPVVAKVEETKASSSYPGLPTKYTFSDFEIAVPDELYKQEGYVEKGKILTSYFVWGEKV